MEKPGITIENIGLGKKTWDNDRETWYMSVKPGLCPLNQVYVMKLRITIEKPSICPLNLVYVR